MDRRKYLALVGSGLTLPLAGCTGGDDGNSDDNSSGDDSSDGGDNGSDDSNQGNGGDSTDDSAPTDGNGGENDSGDDDDSSDGNEDDGSGDNGADDGSGDGGDSGDGGENGDDGGENGQSNPTVEFQSISAVGGSYDPDTVEISDTGGTVSDPIALPQGVVTVEFEYQASGNFIVEAVDGPGIDELLVNRIGAVSGVAGASIRESGEYRLEIDADGDFSLTLAAPDTSDETPPMVPVSASGTGPDVVGPVELAGGEVATASHSGDSNFIVEVAREDGSGILSSDIVYNEVGSVDESEAVVDLEGRCWVLVEADGDWSIELE